MGMVERGVVVFIILCVAGLVFATGFSAGGKEGIANTKREAVKAGCAEWVSSETGGPEFKWKATVKAEEEVNHVQPGSRTAPAWTRDHI